MKKHLYIYVVLVFFLHCISIKAIEFPDLRFRHYTVENGLSMNTVTGIIQDSKGFMWISTLYGLNRYDGRSFKVFKPDVSGALIKSGNSVYNVIEDDSGCFWASTDFGVYILDPQYETFTFFSKETKDKVGIHSRVYSIIRDNSGNIWIGTFGQGAFYYDIQKDELRQFLYNPEDKRSICSDFVRCIYEDSRGIIWILGFDCGFSSFNPKTKEVKHYQTDNRRGPYDRYDVMYEDSQGELWFGNFTYGISKLDIKTGVFTHFLTPNDKESILHVRSIVEYSPGVLLLASDDGLTFFDTATGNAKTVKSNSYNLSGLNDDYLHALYFDKEGGLWIGSYFGGINYSSPAYNNFAHHSIHSGETPFPGRIVSVMCEDNKGNIWIGTDDAGLIFYDIKEKKYTHYLPQKDKNSLSYHNIHALLHDSDKLWIGTYSGGLDCLDLKTGLFKNYTHNNNDSSSLPHSSVYALHKDKKGDMWIGTPWGLAKYNKTHDNFDMIQDTHMSDISCIAEDHKGYMWVTTLNNGLWRLNRATLEWRNYSYAEKDKQSLSSNILVTVMIDERGQLWIGTDGGGICRYNYENDNFERYDDIFPSSTVNKIISDNGVLWISTSAGLIRFMPENRLYKRYNQSDGLQSIQFNPNSGFKATDGTLYFGGINGFNSFKSNMLRENTLVPNLVVTNFQLFNKNVSCKDENSILTKAIAYNQDLVLNYDHSVIGFEFVALSYMAAEKNKYQYKLEGFDKDWIMVDGEPRASYTNLPAGKYEFKVKASNNDGLWNETGITYNIKVLPPFWRTNWAIFIYILLLIISCVYAIQMFKKRVYRRHQEHFARISIEKEKELYDAKIEFFTYMVHEIRTPLSLILAPLEYVLKSNKRVNEVRDDLLVVQRNSNRLLDLVNQLMDFRKIDAGGMSVKLDNIEINSVITQVYERFKVTAGHKNITMSLNLLSSPYIVHSDTEALNKIMSNLLNNAVKFTKTTININVLQLPNNEGIVVSIEDDGSGVPAEEKEKIFKPFYQIKENRLMDMAGTGVGLTLTKSLAERLGATLSILDAPNGGAIFSIKIPDTVLQEEVAELLYSHLPAAQDESHEELEEEDLETSDEFLDTHIPQLLVVDDNADIVRLLYQQLHPYYMITCATNGAEALQCLSSQKIDMVVSDVMMPIMDGFELCNAIKSNVQTSHIPVVLLTAKVNIEAMIEGLENGADAYIEKPFSIAHLQAQISSLLLNREKIKQQFASSPTIEAFSIVHSKADAQFIQKMEQFINDNMADTEFSIGDIAEELGMSRSSFFAKIRAVSGQTPSNYIRLARLKKAAELFAAGETRVNEVCYIVGFNSPSYFSKCFQKQFGTLPASYIKNFQKETLEEQIVS